MCPRCQQRRIGKDGEPACQRCRFIMERSVSNKKKEPIIMESVPRTTPVARRIVMDPPKVTATTDPMEMLLGPGYRTYVIATAIQDLTKLLQPEVERVTVTMVIEHLRKIQ